MKLGLENRTRTATAVVLMSLAFVLVGRLLMSLYNYSSTPQTAQIECTLHDQDGSLDPTIRSTRLEFVENERYHGSGRNIFRDAPEPARNGHSPEPLPIPPTPTPVTAEPQIALRFFGFVLTQDIPRRGFFGEGDAVFVAGEGQIVERRYRILRIDANSVEVEDLIQHSKHTLSLPG